VTWRVGIDVGGTFTDLIAMDAVGHLSMAKVPSTPAMPEIGVVQALVRAAENAGTAMTTFLGDTSVFIHGTTIATNALLEGKVVPVGLLTTDGFRDVLTIRRGIRDNMWDFRTPYPAQLSPRRLRSGIAERVTPSGGIRLPVNPGDITAAVETLRGRGAQAIAIAFLNSYLNAANEQAAAQAIRATCPDLFLSVSSELIPVMGEYERTSTTVANAAVGPLVAGYLLKLVDELRRQGFVRRLLISLSNGGFAPAEDVINKPVSLMFSGPAAGAAAGTVYSRCLGRPNAIFFDMGGTSCDISVITGHEAAVTTELQVGGHHLAIPSIDIHSIGTGGGTEAFVDEAGLLRVGPRSAGADPGPACYGRGGMRPTVTDANLVLGRLNAENFLGGSIRLRKDLAAESVLTAIAKPLGVSLDAAAAGVLRIADQNMVNAITLATAQRGLDARKFALIGAGGAAGLHAGAIARALDIDTVYIPQFAAGSCALGMLFSRIRHDYVRSFLDEADRVDLAALDKAIQVMVERAQQELRADGVADEDVTILASLGCRYVGQQSTLETEFALPVTSLTLKAAVTSFHEKHFATYGHQQLDGKVELRSIRIQGLGPCPIQSLPHVERTQTASPQKTHERSVYLDGAGWRTIPVLPGGSLSPGMSLEGPAVIEEPTTTILLEISDRGTVDDYGNYLLSIGRPA
jgi:N-methylhydantoinase A